jgi:hypothetical protein
LFIYVSDPDPHGDTHADPDRDAVTHADAGVRTSES